MKKTISALAAASLVTVVLAHVSRADAPATEPPPPRFDAEAFPAERSKAPTPDEWRDAPKVAATQDAKECRVYRVREWLKVRCSGFIVAAVGQAAGPRDGANVFIDGAVAPKGSTEVSPFSRTGVTVQFPSIRGDGHVFQIMEFGDSYEGVGTPVVKYFISEYWAEGEPAPTVVIR